MKLVILCQSQYGYHLDTWYYTKYLKCSSIDYVCWDYGNKHKESTGVKAHYVTRKGSPIIRLISYFLMCIKVIREVKPDRVFIKYFKFCFVFRFIFPRLIFVLDVRTADVSSSPIKRQIYDGLLKLEAKFFLHISVISKSLRDRLALPKSSYMLPLGADKISSAEKEISTIKLIYIGTLTGRCIDKTLYGFKKFIDTYGETSATYDVIGSGWSGEEDEIRKIVIQCKMQDIVHVHGYIHHDDLGSYVKKVNVGVSFVPIEECFDAQPPTKTYEYLMSNMIVLATKTAENINILRGHEGRSLLIEDTVESFYEGMCKIYLNKEYYSSRDMEFKFTDYQWPTIVNNFNRYLCSLEVDE